MPTADQVLPPHHVRARNAATASENKIHDDDVAREHGFAGGLVPGITVFGYLTTPIVEAWGESWLERGLLSARFRQPIYDGDDVTVVGTPTGDGDVALEARNQAGEVCALGQAGLQPGEPELPALDDYPEASLPASRARVDMRSPSQTTSTLVTALAVWIHGPRRTLATRMSLAARSSQPG